VRRVNFQWAPASSLPAERRGRVVARFCKRCASFYPLFATLHAGKPSFGKDHVSSPCVCEGLEFAEGAGWWEPGVEVLPAPTAAAPAAPPAVASAPGKA
jgi:hypothetical protein